MIKLAFSRLFKSLHNYQDLAVSVFLGLPCSAADLKPLLFLNDRSNRLLGILSIEEKPPAF
jgi:hypothetical protein